MSLQLCTTTREINQYCFRDSQLVHTTATIANIPNSVIKDLQLEKPKTYGLKSWSDSQRSSESFEKVWKEIKKE